MGWKKLALCVVFLGIFAGVLMAISGATPGTAVYARWAGSSAGSVATTGGNITNVNVTSLSLTNKWAAWFGNVTGTILLGTNTNSIYNWTSSNGTGKICLSTGSAADFLTPIAAVAATIDTTWSMTGADTAASTFSGTCPDLVLSTGTATSPIRIIHQAFSNFTTCAITMDGATTKAATAFCGNITGTGPTTSIGHTYDNRSANYEIMTPVTPAGTDTYYFYAELG